MATVRWGWFATVVPPPPMETYGPHTHCGWMRTLPDSKLHPLVEPSPWLESVRAHADSSSSSTSPADFSSFDRVFLSRSHGS